MFNGLALLFMLQPILSSVQDCGHTKTQSRMLNPKCPPSGLADCNFSCTVTCSLSSRQVCKGLTVQSIYRPLTGRSKDYNIKMHFDYFYPLYFYSHVFSGLKYSFNEVSVLQMYKFVVFSLVIVKKFQSYIFIAINCG